MTGPFSLIRTFSLFPFWQDNCKIGGTVVSISGILSIMSTERLKTAVLGLSERGLLLLEAAREVESLEIIAVADKDTNQAEKTAAEIQCAFLIRTS